MDRNTRYLFVGYYLFMVLFLLSVLAVEGMMKLHVPAPVTFPFKLILMAVGTIIFLASVAAIYFFTTHGLHRISLILPAYHVVSHVLFFFSHLVVFIVLGVMGAETDRPYEVIGFAREVSLFLELLFAIFILYRFNTDKNKIGWLARRKDKSGHESGV